MLSSFARNKHDKVLQIVEGTHPEGWRQWMALTDDERQDMLLQTQSVGYQEWMDEDDWEECRASHE